MTADRRNAFVVAALIVSMTIGAGVLLLLEPGVPRWPGNTLLAAEQPLRVEEVEIAYARSPEEVPLLDGGSGSDDTILPIYPDGTRGPWEPRGPRVRLVVVGAVDGTVGEAQKKTLLFAVHSLSGSEGRVPVRLGDGSDATQTEELRKLLVLKQIIQ